MSKKYTFEVFLEDTGLFQWRWKLIAPNGKIIATSGEGYENRAHCLRMIGRLRTVTLGADLVVPDSKGKNPAKR